MPDSGNNNNRLRHYHGTGGGWASGVQLVGRAWVSFPHSASSACFGYNADGKRYTERNMTHQWLEFESFHLYPATGSEPCRVDATFIDVATGSRSTLRKLPVYKPDDGPGMRIIDEPPWDAMPASEREYIESQLDAACFEAGCVVDELDRPETILPLPRVRHIVPEIGKPGQDKEVDNIDHHFVPPFKRDWERLFDGELAEPIDTSVVFRGIEVDAIHTVRALGRGLRVLDVGCSAGVTGEKAKKLDPDLEWIGVDILDTAVDEAKERLDAAHLIDIERDEIPYPEGCFDVAVCSQLLEHLYNPWQAARRIVRHLKDGGVLHCSVPHAGHVAVLAQLLQGRYPLSSSGPLDISHIRTFTAEMILQLVERAGCQPMVLTKSMFRMTRHDDALMAGIIDAARRADMDCEHYVADGWTVGFTVVARKQKVTVADQTALVRRADREKNNGELEESIRLLELEISLHPQNALAYLRLAESMTVAGRHNEAVDVLTKCATLHPSYLTARYDLIRALHDIGDTDRAAAQFEEALKTNVPFYTPLKHLLA